MTLMDGVTLVDIVYNNNEIGMILLIIVAVITSILGLIGVVCGTEEDEPVAVGVGIISILITILCLIFRTELESTNGEIHYKVLIDSNVNYTELMLKEKGE